MKICQMSADERPREKMLMKGVRALSNADLLAIVLRTGTGKKNVLEIARELLAKNDNCLTQVVSLPLERMQEESGIGPSKAAMLAGVFEMVRRIMEEEPRRRSPQLSEAKLIYLYMEPRLGRLDHEEAWMLCLSRKCKLLSAERLSQGSFTETHVDIKDIIAKALEKKAYRIILLHNHPEGDPTPGQNDIKFTMKLKSALQPTGIQLMDHIIIGHKKYYSFSEDRSL